MNDYLNPTKLTARIVDAAAEGEGYSTVPAEVTVLAEILTEATEQTQRLRLAISRIDHRIKDLREAVKAYGESLARYATRAVDTAVNAPEGKPYALGRSSTGFQLDEAIIELNTLVEQRKFLAYVLEGE